MKQKKLNILFRTAGGFAPKKQLGLGHIYRCINLADHLKPHKNHFLVDDYKGVKKIFQENGYRDISLLKKPIDLNYDIRKTIEYIVKNNIDIVIVDKYCINPQYLSELNKFAKTVIISDLKNIEYPSNLVVNGFIGFKNKIIKNRYGTRCLLGPSYQILNENFTKKKPSKKEYTLLATFGGLDENNIVEILLSSLAKYLKKIKIKIILGPVTIKSKKIKTLEKYYGKYVKIVQKTRNMYKEISHAEFGLCSGGLTTYEFAALNVPFGIISQVDHQLITAKEWHRKKIAFDLGLVNSKTQQNIEKFLSKIIQNKIYYKINKKPLVDGHGTERVAHEILEL